MGLLCGPKTDSDGVKDTIWVLLYVDLCNGKGIKGKVVPPGVELRASGLRCQHSATELRHPPTTTPLSCPYNSDKVTMLMKCMQLIAVCVVNVRSHQQNYCRKESLRPSYKGKKERWLSLVVVAQWQNTGSLSQRSWVQLPVAPPFFQSLCHF